MGLPPESNSESRFRPGGKRKTIYFYSTQIGDALPFARFFGKSFSPADETGGRRFALASPV